MRRLRGRHSRRFDRWWSVGKRYTSSTWERSDRVDSSSNACRPRSSCEHGTWNSHLIIRYLFHSIQFKPQNKKFPPVKQLVMVMFKRRVAGRITISQRVYPADIFDLITFVVWSTSIKKESRDMHLSNTCSTEGRKICRGAPHSFLSALLRLPVIYTVPLRVSRLHCSQLVCIRVHCTRFE